MDYRQMATDAATRHGLPVPLFLRLVNQESGWQPAIVSPAGAIGLGQLMPGTASDLGVDPWDPAQNLDGAARYLRQQYDSFGNWDHALAAYNAGPGRVREYNGVPPFEETQNYVRAILGGMNAGDLPMNSTLAPLPQALPAQGQAQMDLPQDMDFWNRLAIGMQGLTLTPDQGIIDLNKAAIQNRAAARTKNETAQWLEQQGRSDLAGAMMAGGLSGADAMRLALTPAEAPDQTALMQNYTYATEVLGLSPEDARKWVKGGTSVNIGAGDTALDKLVAEQVGNYITGVGTARQNLANLDALETLSDGGFGAGAAWRDWAQSTLGIPTSSSNIEAFQAIIRRMTPAMMPPGSGPLSDSDIKMLRESLPALVNSPEGNRAIIAGLRMMNEYQLQAGAIANRVLTGELTPSEAMLQINQIQPSTSLADLIELPLLQARLDSGETLTDAEADRLAELIRQELYQ